MPVLDWSRTQLNVTLQDGKQALLFNMVDFAVFDIHLLQRQGASTDYTTSVVNQAKRRVDELSEEEKQHLCDTVLQGLPGAEESFSLDSFHAILADYEHIGQEQLKAHLFYFLEEVIPIAEKAGVKMAIHPDDPPWPLLGLPRIVSSLQDVQELTEVIDSEANGITLCTGSFGAGIHNDVVRITQQLAHRINFVHLRNVTRDERGNFMESDHLDGDINFYEILSELHKEEIRRIKVGRTDWKIPMRPDHGHLMLDDQFKQKTNPGYSLLGRMKGLAEIRGMERAIINAMQ